MLAESVKGFAGQQREVTISVLVGIAVGVFLVGPRAAPGTLVLLGLLAVVVVSAGGALIERLRRVELAFALLLGLVVWSLLSVIWAADRPEAFSKSMLLGGLVLATWVCCTAVQLAPAEWHERLGRAALVAFGLCLAFLLFEEVTRHAVKRLVYTYLPFLGPNEKHSGRAEHDNLLMVSDYVSNRNMAALALMLWPMLLLTRAVVDRGRRVLVASVLLILALATSLKSVHETSVISITAAALILCLTLWRPRIGLALLAAGWVTATLLVVPVATLAYGTAQLHAASWLPNSARQRIVIWGYAAQHVPQRPVLGVGAASTKALDARRGPQVELAPGTRYQFRSSPHAHNVYLQVWYELGAVGALLLCAFGLAIIRAIGRVHDGAVPYAAAAFAGAAVIAASTWGLWQAWFLAAFGMSAAAMMIALAAGGSTAGLGGTRFVRSG